MTIQVGLYVHLRQYIPNSDELVRKDKWEVAEGVTIDEVLKRLSLPKGIKVNVSVNGVHCFDKERVLENGDSLLVYPVMAGG